VPLVSPVEIVKAIQQSLKNQSLPEQESLLLFLFWDMAWSSPSFTLEYFIWVSKLKITL
jgi:hypothetical protein